MKTPRLILAILLVFSATFSFAQTPPSGTNDSSSLDSLTGTWYTSGDIQKVSYIAKANSQFFTINEYKDTMELSLTAASTLIAKRSNSATTGLVVNNKFILWSNGYWWSRQPVTATPIASPRP